MSTAPTDIPGVNPPAVEQMADALVTAGVAIKQAAETARDQKVEAAVDAAAAAIALAEEAQTRDNTLAAELEHHEESDQWLREQVENQASRISTLESGIESLSIQHASLIEAVAVLTAPPSQTPPPVEETPVVQSPASAQPPAPPAPPSGDADALPGAPISPTAPGKRGRVRGV